jgi:hypothetical protein
MKTILRCTSTIGLVILVLVGLPFGIGATRVEAAPLFVSPKGADAANGCTNSASPCATIGRALAIMASGDTIRLAKGTYKESLTIDTAGTRTFEGGWDVAFSVRDPVANKSTWKGDKTNHRALEIDTIGISNTTIIDGVNMSGSVFPKGTFESGAGIEGMSGDSFSPAATGSFTLTLNNVTMDGNKADGSGGAISLQQNDSSTMTLTITHSEFKNNTGEFVGGALDLLCTNTPGTMIVNVSDTLFKANHSTDVNFHAGGGAVSLVSTCTSASLTFVADQFSGNTAKGQMGSGTSGGGAIRVEPNSTGTPTVTLINDVFDANTSQGNGGAIAVFGTSPGSVTLHSRNATLFKGNHAKFNGGGVWMGGAATADFVNDIIWAGTVAKGGVGRDLDTDGTPSVSLNHTDIGNIGAGTTTVDAGGNLSVDPTFNKNNFTLKTGSPMIDSGVCSAPSGPPVPTDDFFHHPRPDPAGPDPTKCDRGAAEF